MTRKSAVPVPIRSVAIVAKKGAPEGAALARELATWLRRRRIEARIDENSSQGALPTGTDLVVVAGGDGTLLSVARAAGPAGIPILSVNFGGLGFLTELHPDELHPCLDRVLRGEYAIEERQCLRVRFRGAGRARSEHTVLNDAVITKSALARMITLDVRVNDEEVATYTSDGLILSTPTGSTAYNLSAGGPILDPHVKALVLAPICPHTMTYRPLVLPDTMRVEVTLRAGDEDAHLTLDGQIGFPMKDGDSITVDSRARPVRLVRVAERSFFEVLRKKLRWGER